MRWRLAFMAIAALLAVGAHELTAQDATLGSWQAEARARLKAIYEYGEFRAETFRGDWLEDSSAYIVRQRDPGTDEETVVRYDVESGERASAFDGGYALRGRQVRTEAFADHILELIEKPVDRLEPQIGHGQGVGLGIDEAHVAAAGPGFADGADFFERIGQLGCRVPFFHKV